MNNLGARVYGLGAIAMGIAGLLWADFALGGLAPPDTLPGRALLAYIVAGLLLAGGLLIQFRRNWGAILLTVFFALDFVLLDLMPLLRHVTDFGYWESGVEPLALAAAGLIAFAPPRVARIAMVVFGGCLIVFGAAHFVYATFSATFVPKYMPPSQIVWVYVTGVAAIAAGLAIISGVQALLGARLLTLMYVLFQFMVHVPFVLAPHANHGNWVEFVVNLALTGAAWIVADALAARQAPIRMFHASRGMS